LNFNKNIRGKAIKLDLFTRLRDERRFASAGALIKQIKKDIVRARAI
jgi:FAD synthase